MPLRPSWFYHKIRASTSGKKQFKLTGRLVCGTTTLLDDFRFYFSKVFFPFPGKSVKICSNAYRLVSSSCCIGALDLALWLRPQRTELTYWQAKVTAPKGGRLKLSISFAWKCEALKALPCSEFLYIVFQMVENRTEPCCVTRQSNK